MCNLSHYHKAGLYYTILPCVTSVVAKHLYVWSWSQFPQVPGTGQRQRCVGRQPPVLLNGQALTCCHLGNCCQGNVPGGLTDLSWHCATGLQQVCDSEGPLVTNAAVVYTLRLCSIMSFGLWSDGNS